MTTRILFIYLALFSFLDAAFGTGLDELLEKAYNQNVSLKSYNESYQAEESLVVAKATLDDPMLGVSTLNRGNETKYSVVSQKINFPVKYYLQAKAQSSFAKFKKSEMTAKKYEIRRKIISLYYEIFSSQKSIQLTEANMQAVREFSRIAERKYAAGKTTQGDSMKAHFELTQLELELIRMKQEEEALQDKLRAELNDFKFTGLNFAKQELSEPKFKASNLSLTDIELHKNLEENSPKLKSELFKLKESEYNSSLAKWEFAPDFQLQYQRRISGLPEDSDIFTVTMSVPLWFWKKGSVASAASAKQMAQEYRVKATSDDLLAKINDLKGKVETGVKTLEIYKTGLIPQALGAYNSSRSSYRASKVTFLDLLDSERSLYRVKIGYYKSLSQYVENLVLLEEQLGFSVSDIDNIKGDLK